METTGRVKDISKDWKTGKYILTLTLEHADDNGLNEISGLECLDISVKKHRNKRSLNANALLWKCLSDIAVALRSDKWSVYLAMLKRYGCFTYVCVKPSAVEMLKRQWRECEEVGEIDIHGEKAIQMLCYYGSSTYDTKQFSVLLDGVISEMKEMGLKTPPSQEMLRCLEAWEKQCTEQ